MPQTPLTSPDLIIASTFNSNFFSLCFSPLEEASLDHGFQGGLELSRRDSDHVARWQPNLDSDHTHSDASVACFTALVFLSQGSESAFVDVYSAWTKWLWKDSFPHIGMYVSSLMNFWY